MNGRHVSRNVPFDAFADVIAWRRCRMCAADVGVTVHAMNTRHVVCSTECGVKERRFHRLTEALRIRFSLPPQDFTDAQVIDKTGDTFARSRIELRLACQDLWREIRKAWRKGGQRS